MPNRVVGFVLCVTICVLVSMMIFGIDKGLYSVALPVFSMGMLLCGSLPLYRWSAIDWIVTAIIFFDIVSPFYSICRIPAIGTACDGILLWAAYVLFRRLLYDRRMTTVMVHGLGFVFAVAAVLAVVTFALCSRTAKNVGFDDVYMARYLYRPLGFPNNCWAEIALLMIGFGCLCNRFRGIIVCIAAISALFTFSRGVYVSFIIFVVVLIAFLRPLKEFRSVFAGLFFAVIIVVAVCPREVLTTVSMTKTLSQRNSIEWRKNTTDNAINAFQQHPTAGYGNNSFSLVTDKVDSDDSFTVTAPNLPSLVLVEKGLVGVVLWLVLILASLAFFFRNRKEHGVVISGATLFALLAKELSQSVMAYVPVLALLSAFLLAYMQRMQCCSVNPVSRVAGVIVAICVFPCLSKRYLVGYVRENDQELLAESVSCIECGDLSVAIRNLEQIDGMKKYDGYVNLILSELYMQTGLYDKAYFTVPYGHGASGLWIKGRALYCMGFKQDAVSCLSEAIIRKPALINTADFDSIRDLDIYSVLLFDIDSKMTCKLPEDKAHYGYIFYYTGREEAAESFLQEAVAESPSLRTPWKLLGDTDKYNFLVKGGLNMSENDVNTGNLKKKTVLEQLLEEYRNKYQAWYSL